MIRKQLPQPRPDRTTANGMIILARQPILYCDECGTEYSANPGDYWDVPDTHVFTCCDAPMRLVDKHTVYEDVEV